jgi:hypothetical protein
VWWDTWMGVFTVMEEGVLFCRMGIPLIIIIIIIGIQPLGRSGQRPELSQETGMALVCCILGKFLGLVCHYFPLFIALIYNA